MAGYAGIKTGALLSEKRRFILSEKSRCLVSREEFYGASLLFQDIKDDENETSLGLKFLMAECYVRLGRELKSEREMKSIREEFLMSPTDSVDLMETLANGYKFDDSSCVREIFVRKLLSDMYFCSDLPHKKKIDDAYKRIQEIQEVSLRIYKKANPESSFNLKNAKTLPYGSKEQSDETKISHVDSHLKVIALDHGAQYMLEIFDSLKRMDCADSKNRAHNLAKSTNAIGYFYGIIGDNKRSIALRKEGIEIMNEEFGAFAANYNLYGDLHHNTGVCLYNLDRYKEAEQYYLKAIESYQKAVDYPFEEMRSKDLRQSESDLKDTRQML